MSRLNTQYKPEQTWKNIKRITLSRNPITSFSRSSQPYPKIGLTTKGFNREECINALYGLYLALNDIERL